MATKQELQRQLTECRNKLASCQTARQNDAALIADLRAQLAAEGESPPPPAESPVPTNFKFYDALNTIPADWHWQIGKPFTVKPTVENGRARIQTPPQQAVGPPSFSRRVWDANAGEFTPRGEGAEIWFGGTYQFANAATLKWTRLLAMSSYQSENVANWTLAFHVREPGIYVVSAADYGYKTPSVLFSGLPIPSGRAFRIDIHAKLAASDGDALTEVFVDGAQVGSSTRRNMWKPEGATSALPLRVYQGGLPHWHPDQPQQIVYFDDARFSG